MRTDPLMRDPAQRRVTAELADFLAYRVACPTDGTLIGPRFVTREHADVPPDPPFAATVRCPKDGQVFEVVFATA